jgi:hypothetical protein
MTGWKLAYTASRIARNLAPVEDVTPKRRRYPLRWVVDYAEEVGAERAALGEAEARRREVGIARREAEVEDDLTAAVLTWRKYRRELGEGFNGERLILALVEGLADELDALARLAPAPEPEVPGAATLARGLQPGQEVTRPLLEARARRLLPPSFDRMAAVDAAFRRLRPDLATA